MVTTEVINPAITHMKTSSTIEIRPATTLEYGQFFQLMVESGLYLERILARTHWTLERFCCLFWTVGQVYSLLLEGGLAGFCWIEERGQEAHPHGIVLGEKLRGLGLDSLVVRKIEACFGSCRRGIGMDSHPETHVLYRRLDQHDLEMTPKSVSLS